MPKRRGKRRFTCEDPPCIHVVYDERRKIFAVFIEFDSENIYQLRAEELEKACQYMSEVRQARYREARFDETDYLATRYLGATPAAEEFD